MLVDWNKEPALVKIWKEMKQQELGDLDKLKVEGMCYLFNTAIQVLQVDLWKGQKIYQLLDTMQSKS